MKPYGIPRCDDFANPDKGDIHSYARKSSVGKSSGKSGDYHSSYHSSSSKKNTRRIYKKRARVANKNFSDFI